MRWSDGFVLERADQAIKVGPARRGIDQLDQDPFELSQPDAASILWCFA